MNDNVINLKTLKKKDALYISNFLSGEDILNAKVEEHWEFYFEQFEKKFNLRIEENINIFKSYFILVDSTDIVFRIKLYEVPEQLVGNFEITKINK